MVNLLFLFILIAILFVIYWDTLKRFEKIYNLPDDINGDALDPVELGITIV